MFGFNSTILIVVPCIFFLYIFSCIILNYFSNFSFHFTPLLTLCVCVYVVPHRFIRHIFNLSQYNPPKYCTTSVSLQHSFISPSFFILSIFSLFLYILRPQQHIVISFALNSPFF